MYVPPSFRERAHQPGKPAATCNPVWLQTHTHSQRAAASHSDVVIILLGERGSLCIPGQLANRACHHHSSEHTCTSSSSRQSPGRGSNQPAVSTPEKLIR